VGRRRKRRRRKVRGREGVKRGGERRGGEKGGGEKGEREKDRRVKGSVTLINAQEEVFAPSARTQSTRFCRSLNRRSCLLSLNAI